MNRRGFLSTLLAAPLAAAGVVRAQPIPVKLRFLRFHPDAFAFTMAPLEITPAMVKAIAFPVRFDVICGWGRLHPDVAVRVEGA